MRYIMNFYNKIIKSIFSDQSPDPTKNIGGIGSYAILADRNGNHEYGDGADAIGVVKSGLYGMRSARHPQSRTNMHMYPVDGVWCLVSYMYEFRNISMFDQEGVNYDVWLALRIE